MKKSNEKNFGMPISGTLNLVGDDIELT